MEASDRNAVTDPIRVYVAATVASTIVMATATPKEHHFCSPQASSDPGQLGVHRLVTGVHWPPERW